MKESKKSTKDGLFIKINKWILLLSSIATIVCAIPVIRQCINDRPKAELHVGNTDISETESLSLYYIVKRGQNRKYQLPMPFSLYNKSHEAVNNLSVSIATTDLIPVSNSNGGYMKRLIGDNDYIHGNKQTILLPMFQLAAKCYMNLDNSLFNVIDEKTDKDSSYVKNDTKYLLDDESAWIWDDFTCNINITHDNIEHPIIVQCNVYCLYNNIVPNAETIIERHTKADNAFMIYVENANSYMNADSMAIQMCSVLKIKKI